MTQDERIEQIQQLEDEVADLKSHNESLMEGRARRKERMAELWRENQRLKEAQARVAYMTRTHVSKARVREVLLAVDHHAPDGQLCPLARDIASDLDIDLKVDWQTGVQGNATDPVNQE